MQEATFNISGMTCQGCVNSVTNALRRVAGVAQATVSLEHSSAHIQFDADKTSVDSLKSAVEAAGFDVS